jgi:DNA replication and repair protein RecF
MARQGGPGGFGVAADLAGEVRIATGARADAPERRVVRVNGAAAAANGLPEWLTVLWLTPAMDRLFADAPGGRRRFLDRLALALHPGHAGEAARYDAAMRERGRVLAEGGDARWLGALEARMGEHGAAVARARADTVARLGAALAAEPEGAFARASLRLDGWTGTQDELAGGLARNRARDASAGRAGLGPHRDDLLVTHAGKGQAAALCSTGEQKALLLGIVLAHAGLVAAEAGRRPVLLLDEVAAHLDPVRRAALFARLAGLGQVWMTGTEPALFEAAGEAVRVGLG